ncbi:MAG TPA: hypothetical protein VLS47_04525, partial [Gallionella sp.]|nr:hypothetical protein [Gallionella sp.]
RGWLIYQIEVIGLVYLAATLARYIAALFTTGYEVLSKEFGLNLALTVNIAALGVSGAVFVTLIGLTIWARPGLIGVKPGDWLQLFKIRS